MQKTNVLRKNNPKKMLQIVMLEESELMWKSVRREETARLDEAINYEITYHLSNMVILKTKHQGLAIVHKGK